MTAPKTFNNIQLLQDTCSRKGQLESFKFESLKLESFSLSWSEVGEFLLVLESFAVKNNKVNGLEMSKSKAQNC